MLTNKIAEAKAESLDTFEELARQGKILEGLTTALHRASPCWPSRWGWGVSLCLALYVLLMHSNFYHERHQLWDDLKLQEESRTAAAKRELEMTVRQLLAEEHAKLDGLVEHAMIDFRTIEGDIAVLKRYTCAPSEAREHQ